ncbi:ATP-binding protein [Pantoea sp. B65]|uniref:ATP-binding protein n=1 Tax=Pantoea sp. B65 TaxID=2813359 RepID=UPI0039B3C260
MESVTTSLSLPATLESLAQLSTALHNFVAPYAIAPSLLYQVDLASCEALSNIIRHALQLDHQRYAEITLSYSPECLTLALSDTGTPIPPEVLTATAKNLTLVPDPRISDSWPEGGMGLQLIYALMDNVQYRSEHGRNTLILTRRLDAA